MALPTEILLDVLNLLLISSITTLSHSSDSCEELYYFGPDCEYFDLRTWSYNITVDNSFKTNGRKCIDVPGPTGKITIELYPPAIPTWIRVKARDENSTSDISISMTLVNRATVRLSGEKRAIWNTTVDVVFEPAMSRARFVIVEGSVHSTCDIFISKGQNLADNYENLVSMSSTFSDQSTAQKCIDHDVRTFCHTEEGDVEGYWRVYFPLPSFVYEIDLLNRQNSELIRNRARGHRLSLHVDFSTTVWSYRDISHSALYRYVQKPNIVTAVWGFQVQNREVLNYVEIEVFGDYLCPKGKYGTRCQHDCRCADASEQCFYTTGGCPGGCVPGYEGMDCSEFCPPLTFGFKCAEVCSEHCAGNGSCHHVNGTCNDGCKPGYVPPFCTFPKHGIVGDLTGISVFLVGVLGLILTITVLLLVLRRRSLIKGERE